MARILVGDGSAQAVLEVHRVPKVGDQITVRKHQIKWARTANAYIMVGDTFVVTSEHDGKVNVGGEQMPWFDLRNVEFQ